MDMFSKKFSSKLHAEELEPKDPFCIKYPIYCDVIYTIIVSHEQYIEVKLSDNSVHKDAPVSIA